jgi:hypothetical protein
MTTSAGSRAVPVHEAIPTIEIAQAPSVAVGEAGRTSGVGRAVGEAALLVHRARLAPTPTPPAELGEFGRTRGLEAAQAVAALRVFQAWPPQARAAAPLSAVLDAGSAAALLVARARPVPGAPAPIFAREAQCRRAGRAFAPAADAALSATTGATAPSAVLGVGLEKAADAVTAVAVALPADALSIAARTVVRARVVTNAAVAVGFQDSAPRVATGQVRGAFLATAAAVVVVCGQIRADATTAALSRLATGAVAAVGVLRAGNAVRATCPRIGIDINTETVTVRQILRTGTDAADLVPVADRARAAAVPGAFAA